MVKKNLRKGLSLVLLITLIMVQMLLSLQVAADPEDPQDPQMPQKAIAVLDEEGKQMPIGNDNANAEFQWIGDYFCKKNLTPVDFTAAKYVEFDFYISDYNALKTVMDGSAGKVSTIRLGIGSDATSQWNQRSVCDFFNQVTQTGWNHIKLLKSDFFVVGTNWANVSTWMVGFEGTAPSGYKMGDAYDVEFGMKNLCGTLEDPLPSAPSNVISQIDPSIKFKSIGNGNADAEFQWIGDYFMNKNLTPVDLSAAKYIEFDFYVSDYNSLKEVMDASEGKVSTIRFGIGSDAASQWNQRSICDFLDQVKQSGWNHVKLLKSKFFVVGTNWANVCTWMVGFEGSAPVGYKMGKAYNVAFGMMNLCGTAGDQVPTAPTNAIATLDATGKTVPIGNGNASAEFQWIGDYFMHKNITPVDMSAVKYIEFDFYVSDYNAIKTVMDASNGKVNEVKLGIGSEANNQWNQRFAVGFFSQVTKNGWNHIKIPKDSFVNIGSGTLDWTKASTWVVTFEGSAPSGYPMGTAYDVEFGIMNLCGTPKADEPPANVVATLDTDELTKGLGDGDEAAQFHYFSDILYRQNLKPVDFTEAEYVELDVYISDYATLKSVMDASKGAVSSLYFCVGSKPGTDASSRYENRFGAQIMPNMITKSGWTHLQIKKTAFQNLGSGIVDWTKVCTWMFSFNGDNFVGYPMGDAWNINVSVKNIYGTKKAVLVQPNPDQPSKPDSNATYLSTCESIVDGGNSWNPSSVVLDTAYKTEGKSSVSQKFIKQADTSNVMRYVFGETDFSKVTALKFDVLIDDSTLLAKTKFVVLLAGDNRGVSKYNKWDVNTTGWKTGWNSVEIDITKGFTTDGNADITKIHCFSFGCSNSNFGDDDCLTVRLDNLRVAGSLSLSNSGTENGTGNETGNNTGNETGSGNENPETGELIHFIDFAIIITSCIFLFSFRKKKKPVNE